MMQKQIFDKKIIICVCAAVAVIAVAVVVLLFNREETFRSIMVYDVEGNAVIEREDVGSLNAAENLYLESGDRVSVAQDSSMRMKLDDDKYVMAEAETVFSVEAEGTDENSRTKICLEQGAITNEIQHPLSGGSQYETSTPNSVMAVRGTIYRVELYTDENGEQNTKLCCFQGKVGTKPVLPDGTYGEEVLVPAGSELIVYSDGTMDGPRDIDYEELPRQAVQNLISLTDSGQTLTGISPDDLTKLAEKAKEAGDKTEKREAEQTAASDQDEALQNDTDMKADEDKQADAGADVRKDRKASTATAGEAQGVASPQGTADQSAQNPQAKLPALVAVQPQAAEQVNSAAVNDNTGDDSSQEENSGGDATGDNQEYKDKPDKDKPHKPDKDKPQRPVVYTVTFVYDGKVFATQTVVSGGTVEEPVLIPETTGAWDFDFATIIQADTTITWN